MAKVIVTGGAGFIGSNLALTLEQEGHEVTVLDSLRSGQEKNLENFRGRLLACDVRTGLSPELKKDLQADIVFHHGDITDPRHSDEKEVWESNTLGFQNILDFCIRKNARLVFASTAGLYGNGPVPMKETDDCKVITSYGLSKKWMEDESLKSNIPIVGLRYFNVFGPREHGKGRAASMIYHLGNQIRETGTARLFTGGEQLRDFIYVKDVVKACLCAWNAPSGIYNVGTGVGTSFNGLVSVLSSVLKKPAQINYFDMPYVSDSYQHHTQAETTLAKKRLGFISEWPLEKAVRDYYKWLGWVE